ncbi:DUF1413 domain-containing protein [Phaeovulum vinaykumarii]|uniref:DUF1413 domain-containing protein n=1 Tax=Phaeovulum vinaykumarii TaxID=407234 RepID=A0A1N7M9B6_9RHOB|nr:DUF1413 domain-containing protein [Phaeovulum vinaykumarii]SIS82705.1 protein of unknown function [Phaeovulum vinaykumarii]SOC10731.1 uncharacterized protein DUF1413 [Phaeovulum vinaykumarii]
MRADREDMIRDALAALPEGEFHLPDALGAAWDTLWIGEKVGLGNDFLKAVRAGRFAGIEDTGRKDHGLHLYVKRST